MTHQPVPPAPASAWDAADSTRGDGQRTTAKWRFVEQWLMLTVKRGAVESSLHRRFQSAILADPTASKHAVPEHFDVVCSPA